MPTTTVSSRDFNQDTGRAKKAAQAGPVFITDRGRPAHVLLTVAEFQRLSSHKRSIIQMLAMPGGEQVDFEPVRVGGLSRPAEFD